MAPDQRSITARQLPEGGAQAARVVLGGPAPERADGDRTGDAPPQRVEHRQALAVAAQFDGLGNACQPEVAEQPQFKRGNHLNRHSFRLCGSLSPSFSAGVTRPRNSKPVWCEPLPAWLRSERTARGCLGAAGAAPGGRRPRPGRHGAPTFRVGFVREQRPQSFRSSSVRSRSCPVDWTFRARLLVHHRWNPAASLELRSYRAGAAAQVGRDRSPEGSRPGWGVSQAAPHRTRQKCCPP